MQPRDLRAENFGRYLPQARALVVAHLAVLRRVPLALLPVILRELIHYDWNFPAEQRSITQQLNYLSGLDAASFSALMSEFAAVRLPSDISQIDWINDPQLFSEKLSASLWSTLQMDNYRKAALDYWDKLAQVLVEEPPAIPRYILISIGKELVRKDFPLFRPLRSHGALFTNVHAEDGLNTLLNFAKDRAQKHPERYAHWYIDGGRPEAGYGVREGLAQTSYARLASVAMAELDLTSRFVEKTGKSHAVGPEAVESFMATLSPSDLGLKGAAEDEPLRRFEVSVLTQGAGSQVFSTTFVQWSAREALRRAQPLTLLARYRPRQRAAPMNELLKQNPLSQPTDPSGSLLDADMGAYYTWINQERLPGAKQARFLAWHEGQNTALAIAPGLPSETASSNPASIAEILKWMA